MFVSATTTTAILWTLRPPAIALYGSPSATTNNKHNKPKKTSLFSFSYPPLSAAAVSEEASDNKTAKAAMTSLPLLALVPWKPVLQRALGMYSLFFLAAVLLGPFLAPVQFSFYYVALHCLFLVNNTRTAWAVVKTYYNCISPLKNSSLATTHQASLEDEENMVLKSSTKIPAHATNNGTKNTNTTLEAMQETLYHMIILPNYKESMETLTETLDVLASHQNALVSYKVSRGFLMRRSL